LIGESDHYILEFADRKRVIAFTEVVTHIVKNGYIQLLLKNRHCILIHSPLTSAIARRGDPYNRRIAALWEDREISSFEYIMRLNLSFGRSFKDVSLYPVVPNLTRDISTPHLPPKEVVIEYLRPLLNRSGGDAGAISTSDYDWVPEFFFPSKVVTFAQAYDNRKALENDRLADRLTQWIESVWSVGPHEVRRPFAYFAPRVTEVDLNGFRPLVATTRTSFDKLELSLINKTQILRLIPESQAEIRSAPCEIPLTSDSIAVDFGNGFAIAQPRGHELIIAGRELKTYALGNDPIADIATGDGVVVIAMRNTIVHILRDGELSSFFTYLCSVSSVDISPGYDTIVVASHEGTVLLCSLVKGSVRSSFEIADKHPVKVKITHAWGLIVLLSVDHFGLTYWISSYTMDGRLLNELQLRHRPPALCVFTSGSGFDYIAYANEKKAIYTIDAIRGKPGAPIGVIREKVILLAYDVKKRLLLAVTAGGTVATITAAWE
jgi:hypothetical protein